MRAKCGDEHFVHPAGKVFSKKLPLRHVEAEPYIDFAVITPALKPI
jgi:hypothetical protein